MTVSMSKRQQARNERDLQDLISSVPGNDRCADCQARNPGWASWSLGIFLCMRCAALHRKLGTHISKVKSLSMDTWTSDQVESMRQNGNTVVNKIYNPKNIKPDIPLDVDEVDSAMERFIRQKYQERSLADGKPRPPSRDEIAPPARSSQPSPTIYIQPAKKGKIFGFKLRASSSAYPVSKRETRNLPPLEPTIENAFRTEVHSNKPSKPRTSDASDTDTADEGKLAALREMGFLDDKRNAAVLNQLSGDLSRTVESLIRLGGGSNPASRKGTPVGSSGNTPLKAAFPDSIKNPAAQESAASNNPFDRPVRAQTLAVPQQHEQRAASYNPFDVPSGPQSAFQPMDQAFQAMQISPQPLFPHSTGGYPRPQPLVQDLCFHHSMTPPVPQISQQVGYSTPSPAMYNMNPFFQQMQAQSQPPNVGLVDSYASHQQGAPFSAPPTNPFFGQQSLYNAVQPPQTAPLHLQTGNSNPFGIPPSPQSAPAQRQQHASLFDIHQPPSTSNALPQSFYPQQDSQVHGQPTVQASITTPQQLGSLYQQPPNPYQPQLQPQSAPPQHQVRPPIMVPQQSGRFDKNSILALYNHPQLAPQPMSTILDDSNPSIDLASSNPVSPGANPIAPARRSATMPISSLAMSSSTTGAGSRNPFLGNSNGGSRQSSAVASPVTAHTPAVPNGTIRHASQESVSIANLDSGRHSPDAFANLSARFVR